MKNCLYHTKYSSAREVLAASPFWRLLQGPLYLCTFTSIFFLDNAVLEIFIHKMVQHILAKVYEWLLLILNNLQIWISFICYIETKIKDCEH